MDRTIIKSFDRVSSKDTPCGRVVALGNGSIAFSLSGPLGFGPSETIARKMLDVALAPRGLTWGGFQCGSTACQGYVSRLERPSDDERRPTVQTPSGSVRVARTAEQLGALLEVVAAFQAGDLSTLLTPDSLKLEVRERAKADRMAAKAASSAKQFAHAHWPKALFAMSVSETAQGLVLRFVYDQSVVKAVKESKAVWCASRKTWTLPVEQEVAFGKRLFKIARALGNGDDALAVSQDEQARQREASLLAQEVAEPLTGVVGCLTIGRLHHPNASPGQQHVYTLRFPYHVAMNALVRGIPGAQFYGQGGVLGSSDACPQWSSAQAAIPARLCTGARAIHEVPSRGCRCAAIGAEFSDDCH